MLKFIQKVWLALFILASMVFVTGYFYHDAIKFWHVLHLSHGFLLAAAVIQVFYWFTASSIWRKIVLMLSCAKLSLLQSYCQLTMVGIGKYLPGKVWGMVARGLHLKKHGVSLENTFLATFYEQYILLHASVVLCAALVVVLLPARYFWLAGVAVVLAVVLGTFMRDYGIRGFLFFWHKLRKEGPATVRTGVPARAYLSLLGRFTLLWVLNGLVFSSLYFALFRSMPDVKLIATLILANTVGITVGFLALFAPGGIGVRELVSSAILAHAVPVADAVLLALIYRLWVVAMEMLSGVAILPIVTAFRTSRKTE